MKKIFALLLYIILVNHAQAQSIAINTDGSQPNASAMLDIKSTNKGLLIPRVNLTSETDVSTIPSPVNSLLVFNTNAALPDGVGFYFWNGNNIWSKLATVNASNNIFWGLAGNTGINPATDFIGTIDNTPLVFKANNILSGKIAQGINSVFFGQHAGEAVTSGTKNTFIGHQAGISNTSGHDNVAIGFQALYRNTGGYGNLASGNKTLYSNIDGYNNIAAGDGALYSSTTSDGNIATGYQALYSTTIGGYNVAEGYEALFSNTTGTTNIGIGFRALHSNTSGHGNISLGNQALYSITNGYDNIAIGGGADITLSGLYNTTAIGKNAKVSTQNTMVFGSSTVSKWAFGLPTPGGLHALEVGNAATNGNGAYLSTGGNWTNTSSRIKKDNFTDLNSNDLLQKISQLPIQKWKYKGANEYHIGPVAEDFYALFGLGADNKGISTVDPAGIALAAIKEQQKIITQLLKRIEALEKK